MEKKKIRGALGKEKHFHLLCRLDSIYCRFSIAVKRLPGLSAELAEITHLVIKACMHKPAYLVNFGKKLKAPSVLYYVCHI